ncbi:ATP-binding protein [Candidatus Pacearchaeota archaeon]|nr:ATP-binding protein [Candidatus Pacearchaeota archaeon]
MLSKEQLKQILFDQKKSILKKPLGVEREVLTKINKKTKLPHIIVLTGLRRSGKSTLLRQIIKKHYQDKNFYYINFEDERFFNFNAENFNDIYEVLLELFGKQKTFFIDEIQNVENFELFVRRFYDNGFKFYITGSSAKLLSKELGTKLTGRHLNLIVTPFSFKEFLNFKKIDFSKKIIYNTEDKITIKKHFEEYLFNGGMPEFVKFNEKEILTRIYEDIINKDIIVRYDVKNIIQLRELYQYLITNLANKFNYNNLNKILGIKSPHTTKKFINHLIETYFIQIINKFDYSLKKQIKSEKKPYVLDNGFVSVISLKFTKDKGWLLENLVFNNINENFEINYFENKYECDFILSKQKKIIQAIQVCWELTSENKEREIRGLTTALEEFKLKQGIILTKDQEYNLQKDNKKIFVKPVWKWLLEN